MHCIMIGWRSHLGLRSKPWGLMLCGSRVSGWGVGTPRGSVEIKRTWLIERGLGTWATLPPQTAQALAIQNSVRGHQRMVLISVEGLFSLLKWPCGWKELPISSDPRSPQGDPWLVPTNTYVLSAQGNLLQPSCLTTSWSGEMFLSWAFTDTF